MKSSKLLTRCGFKTCVFFHIFSIMLIAYNCTFPEAKESNVESLQKRIETIVAGTSSVSIGNEPIRAAEALRDFYSQRSFESIWVGKEGLSPDGLRMIDAILEAETEGLNPDDYHIREIESIAETISPGKASTEKSNPEALVDLELLLTDAYLLYGSHLVNGRVNPVTYDPEWKIEYGETDVLQILREATRSGRIPESLQALKPAHSRYAGLREARSKYQKIAGNGGWPKIDNGPTIKVGNKDARIAAIRERLRIEGYRPSTASDDPATYDQDLLQAVMEFQGHYGLEPDGIIGPATIRAMNIPAHQRTRQISLAMERWRWLPRDLGPNYIRVNIANFKLAVIEGDDSVLDMRVIVGRTYRQTPVFSGKMTYLVLNPYWDVPQSIAVKDKLPIIKTDPAYLKNNHMKVFIGRGTDARELDPESIDWNEVTEKNFTFRLRQEPGPGNALGKIKFMFPNSYNVYLHDTPSRDLFDRAVGAFSSGCIRLAKPIELAEYLLKGDGKWDRKAIIETVEKGRETTVRLKEPIPVYLIYLTVLVNEDGTLDFRDDIYNRDKKLDAAMREILPSEM